jgi:hypothetical protein
MVKLLDTLLGLDEEKKFGFPGQQEGEEVEIMTSSHWIVLLPFLTFSIVALGLLLLFDLYFASSLGVPILYLYMGHVVIFTAYIHIFALRLFNFFLNPLIVTNYRVIEVKHTVFLQRERDSIDLRNVQDISFCQSGIWPRIFNYGDLKVFGSSVDVEYHFHHIPNVEKFHSTLGHIHRRANRGLFDQMQQRSIRSNQMISEQSSDASGKISPVSAGQIVDVQ